MKILTLNINLAGLTSFEQEFHNFHVPVSGRQEQRGLAIARLLLDLGPVPRQQLDDLRGNGYKDELEVA